VSDLMRPLSFGHLMSWALTELRRDGSIFGVREDQFWHPQPDRQIGAVPFITDSFGDRLASPVGPAAGPQTQLAANILVAYLTGARFVELKTVQQIDGADLRQAVTKPCIQAQDEGYNCEWSTELTVPEAYDEYVKAYFAIAVLGRELGLGTIDQVGFNISVGYDLEGIKGDKIGSFIDGMTDASGTAIFRECSAWVREHLGELSHFTGEDLDALSPQVSRSVTLSTMHGCPAGEIERIAMHLLTEKHLQTSVKCNPTMLGYQFARDALDGLGYDYLSFDDHHFTQDVQYDEAVEMFGRLSAVAQEQGLSFGVKLTNTFPVQVRRRELPAEEMYMSGRPLLYLSLSLALKLSRRLDGTLPISFSGGVDAVNIAQILSTGIAPVTVATTILKPGGVTRFRQLSSLAAEVMTSYHGIDVDRLEALVDEVRCDERYHKRYREKSHSRKTSSPLPLTDCYKAPCEDGGCPIHQRIPEYLKLTSDGRLREAFDVITLDNTAPTILGVLCSEPCRDHCTRLDYDQAIDIRGVKLAAADGAQDAFIEAIAPPPLLTGAKVAVIGAGPAGIAAAIFLRRNGMAVEVFEKRDGPYGIVRYIIPSFRITREQIERDYQLAVHLGVRFSFGCDPDYRVQELRKTFAHVIIATGSWGRSPSPVSEGPHNTESTDHNDHILDAIDFLWQANNEGGAKLGKRVAVIGAGDVAMDCVRTAARSKGVQEAVIVYRRTEAYMPATQHEVNLVRADGLTMHELLAPISYDGMTLRCEQMRLSDQDSGGRRAVVGLGTFVDMAFDTVIGATGATVQTDAYARNGLAQNAKGLAEVDACFQSSIENVHVIGDGRLGPSTIVRAVADAKTAVRAILHRENLAVDYDERPAKVEGDPHDVHGRRGLLIAAVNGRAEGDRCLTCDVICEVCAEVCPNRANVAITVPGFADPRQIIHIDGLCNECGNCDTFCPHAGRPYKDKITIFWAREDFEDSTNTGFLPLGDGTYLSRTPDGSVRELQAGDEVLPEAMSRVLAAIEKDYEFMLAPAVGAHR